MAGYLPRTHSELGHSVGFTGSGPRTSLARPAQKVNYADKVTLTRYLFLFSFLPGYLPFSKSVLSWIRFSLTLADFWHTGCFSKEHSWPIRHSNDMRLVPSPNTPSRMVSGLRAQSLIG